MDRKTAAPGAVEERAFSGTTLTGPAQPQLRPYQTQALADIRQAYRSTKAVLLTLPTGGGKSVLYAEAARRHIQASPTASVLVVAHRRELVRQGAAHLARSGLNARQFLGGSSVGDPTARVSVAAVQTLTSARWRDRLPPATLVIWDEAHHIVADSFRALHAAYPNAHHLGLTATPQRSDGSPLGDVFGAMVVASTISELTRDGFLVPCTVWAPPTDRTQLADDPADAYIEHGDGKRAIVFCANVKHSESVAARLQAESIPAEHVDGSMPARERDAILARFATGTTRVITNASLVTEGFDVPACKCIVLARGCDSVAMYLQAIGRALRPEPGETMAILLDLRGAVHKHGLPDADRSFSLDGDAISTGSQVDPVRQCLACGHVFRPRPSCPFCGAKVPEPKDPSIRREALQRISEAQTEDQRKEYFDRLWAEARMKGYKPGWVAMRYRVRYGTWPKWRAATVGAA